MPTIRLEGFEEPNGRRPFEEWLETIPEGARFKCLDALEKLRSQGHELRRPVAAPLRDGIYELRPAYLGVQYRILYFFAGKGIVIVSHGFSKKTDKVPENEIERALRRKTIYEERQRGSEGEEGRPV
jgi:phage-related protein